MMYALKIACWALTFVFKLGLDIKVTGLLHYGLILAQSYKALHMFAQMAFKETT